MERKKPGCPAVTLLIKQGDMEIGLDIVLSLEVRSSWPKFTVGGFAIDSWLGTKVKQKNKLRPFYLVPKSAGKGSKEEDRVSAKGTWSNIFLLRATSNMKFMNTKLVYIIGLCKYDSGTWQTWQCNSPPHILPKYSKL